MMRRIQTTLNGGHKGQTAIEYMLLLAIVVAIVLIGFKKSLPRVQNAANLYFDRAAVGIMGDPPPLTVPLPPP
jgi:Flp pilus assembly pilin Flp